jgi:DNA-binding NarL/FixJ family response regulator
MKIRVTVFDDNKTLRNGLELLINSSDRLSCAGAFQDCLHVIDDIKNTKPDVVLMDIDMPYVNGIEALKLVRQKFPSLKILMQTVFEDDDKVFASICAGADGYILKKTSPAKLIESIIEVNEGGAPMTPSVARQVLRLFSQSNKLGNGTEFNLSEREHEILSLLVQGLSYKMIAEHCFISYATVNTHVKHIYEKLQVHSVVEAVTKAIAHKIV